MESSYTAKNHIVLSYRLFVSLCASGISERQNTNEIDLTSDAHTPDSHPEFHPPEFQKFGNFRAEVHVTRTEGRHPQMLK